jgi:hypothetical protein
LKNVRIIDGTDAEAKRKSAIILIGDKIGSIGADILRPRTIPAGAEVLDLLSMVIQVLPGLVGTAMTISFLSRSAATTPIYSDMAITSLGYILHLPVTTIRTGRLVVAPYTGPRDKKSGIDGGSNGRAEDACVVTSLAYLEGKRLVHKSG